MSRDKIPEGYWKGNGKENDKYPEPIQNGFQYSEEMYVLFMSRLEWLENHKAHQSFCKGWSECRFTGESVGSSEFTLGKWRWPVSFRRHYLAKYRVQVSPEFFEFVMNYKEI